MSYWDILTDDLKQHIIDMRDNKIKNENKNNPDYQFKKGKYYMMTLKLKKCWNNDSFHWSNMRPEFNHFFIQITKKTKEKLTIYLSNSHYPWSYLKMYYPKISFDDNNIPFIKIKDQYLNINDKLYFKNFIDYKYWHE